MGNNNQSKSGSSKAKPDLAKLAVVLEAPVSPVEVGQDVAEADMAGAQPAGTSMTVPEPDKGTGDADSKPARLPARDLPEAENPPLLAAKTLDCIDVLCEQTAKRIEAMGDDLVNNSLDMRETLYDFAHAIRSGGLNAKDRLDTFLKMATNIMQSAEEMRASATRTLEEMGAPTTLGT